MSAIVEAMVEYTTKAELRGLGSNLDTIVEARLRKSATSPLNAIFLSHSSKDQDLVLGATRVLTDHGGTVYIDRIDPTMPPYTNKETADKLKSRISQAKRFVLLATANSKDSRWVPWELGVADGKKGLTNIALFPAVDERQNTDWTSWEYMGLYLRVVWGNLKGHEKPLWMVLDETKNSATTLAAWIDK